jgi:hypothetical protein
MPVTLPSAGLPLTPGAGLPAYPTYPGYPAYPTRAPGRTTPTTTRAPTPTPSHAARCPGEPTAAQILEVIKGKPGIPDKPLKVEDGPFCSGDWSLSTVNLAGGTEKQLEPLTVITYGKGADLTLLVAGTDACTNLVQSQAPAAIRVLACGS